MLRKTRRIIRSASQDSAQRALERIYPNANVQIENMVSSKQLARTPGVPRRELSHGKTDGIRNPTIRRLARRGGIKQISAHVYDDVRKALRTFLKSTISDAVTYAEHAKRKTVMTMDIVHALKRAGRPLYGFSVSEHHQNRRRSFHSADADQKRESQKPSRGVVDKVDTSGVHVAALSERSWLSSAHLTYMAKEAKQKVEHANAGDDQHPWVVTGDQLILMLINMHQGGLVDEKRFQSRNYKRTIRKAKHSYNVGDGERFALVGHINIGDCHWIAVRISFDGDAITSVDLFDSLTNGVLPFSHDEMARLIDLNNHSVMPDGATAAPTQINVYPLNLQHDGHSCGIFSLVMVCEIAQTQLAMPGDQVAALLRTRITDDRVQHLQALFRRKFSDSPVTHEELQTYADSCFDTVSSYAVSKG